jgi:NADPH:quinone reductase-like Zn-dependent oxidoreductase
VWAGRWGDGVCALLAGTGYEHEVAIPAGRLLTVPKGVGLVEAAGLPEITTTVWSNLIMTAGLKAGETLPVHGGAGGVGTVGGPEKTARELGADVAVDYRTEGLTKHGPRHRGVQRTAHPHRNRGRDRLLRVSRGGDTAALRSVGG